MKKIYFFGLSLTLFMLQSESKAQCEPFFGKLVINEVVAGNDNVGADEFGEFDDWIEIYNASDEEINMEGIFLSDNHGNRTKFTFPDFVLPSGEVVVVWCDNQPEQGLFHAAFGLNAGGEEVGLYNQDTTSIDYVRYGAIPDDISIG
ncbi:MAG TPA: lamin tail domain-containing protein, partial [Cryomorphaceae bacterium]|nr:lamin tail domain-containing protein [Cryomorphaceae bacterium]